jgi:hypothetical protein
MALASTSSGHTILSKDRLEKGGKTQDPELILGAC